jgi:hypothetical protein
MNLLEALQALKQGKKVRAKTWTKDIYMEIENENIIVNPGQRQAILYTHEEFEIYEELRLKVKRSQALITINCGLPHLTTYLYKDESEIKSNYTGVKILQFPAGLTIEVDE